MFLVWLLELFVRFLAWMIGVAILVGVGLAAIIVQLVRVVVIVILDARASRATHTNDGTWVYYDADPDSP